MSVHPKHDPAGDVPAIPSFTAPLGALVGAIRTVGLALPRGRAAGEQPAGFLLRVGGGALAVGATDGVVYVEAILPVELDSKDGDVLLPAEVGEYLAQLGAGERDGTVRAARSKRSGRLALAIGTRGAEFAARSSDNYAPFPEPVGDPFAVPTASLAAALGLARSAVSHDTERAALGAIRLTLDGDGLALAATDGAKGARAVIPCPNAGSGIGPGTGPTPAGAPGGFPAGATVGSVASRAALVPRRGADLLDRLLAQAGREGRELVTLAVPPPGGATLVLACGPILRAAVRLQEGNFPPLAAVRERVPRTARLAATVLVADLLAAARRCAVVVGESEEATVALIIRGDALLLTAKGEVGAVVEPVAAVVAAREPGVTLLPQHLSLPRLLALAQGLGPHCGQGLVTLCIEDPLAAPLVLVPGEDAAAPTFALLMGRREEQ